MLTSQHRFSAYQSMRMDLWGSREGILPVSFLLLKPIKPTAFETLQIQNNQSVSPLTFTVKKKSKKGKSVPQKRNNQLKSMIQPLLVDKWLGYVANTGENKDFANRGDS